MSQNPYDLFSPEAIAALEGRKIEPRKQPEEKGVIAKIDEVIKTPAIDFLPGGRAARERLATPSEKDAGEVRFTGAPSKHNPKGMAHGGADESQSLIGTALKLNPFNLIAEMMRGEAGGGAKAKGALSGGLEGATPATIAEATTMGRTGKLVYAGVKASGGLGKFLTTKTKAKDLVKQFPEYAKATEDVANWGGRLLPIAANTVVGTSGAATALNEDATTTEKVLGGVQALGGAAGVGFGIATRNMRPKAPKLEVVHGADQYIDAAKRPPTPDVKSPKDNYVVPPAAATDSPRVQRIVTKDAKEADTALGNWIKDKISERKTYNQAAEAATKQEMQAAKVQEDANKLIGKEKVDTEKAHTKFVMDEANQEARNQNAVIKFTDKQAKEEKAGVKDLSKIITSWMDDLDQKAADAAAKKNVDDAIAAGLKPQDPSVTIRSTDKSVPGETRSVSTRFAKPAPEKPEGGGGGGTIPYDPDLDSPDANPGLNQSIVVLDPSTTGPSRPLPKNVNKIQRDLKKARAIAQNYGMGIKQNPDGLYELIPKEANSIAAPTGILTDDVFKTHLEAVGAKNKVGGKIVGSAKSGFKVVGPEDPNPPYNPNDKDTWIDLGGNGPDDLPPAPPPASSPVPAGPKPKGGSPSSGMRVAGPKSGKGAKNILENYSPEELETLDQIIDEMESQPYNDRTWNWDIGENEVGNAAGGKAIIQAGNAGAPVYHELLKFLSGLPETQGGPSRGQILDALKNFRKGNNNIWGRRAIEIAKQRLAKKSEAARLDEWVNTEEGTQAAANVEGPKDPSISSAPLNDEDTLNTLLDIAVNAGYKGDLQSLKAKLAAELVNYPPEFVNFLKETDIPWWEGIDEVADAAPSSVSQVDEVVDVLPTGESQPRLPDEVGSVRDIENPSPEMDQPFALTSEVSTAPDAVDGDLFTSMLRNVPESEPPQGLIPVTALKKSKFDLLGDQQRVLQAEGKAAGEKLPRDIKNHPTSELSDAPRLQGARIAGLGVSKLAKNARIEAENARFMSMSPEEQLAWLKSLKGEKGFAANELGIRSGLAIAGGLGGGAVAEENEIDPALGMVGGAAAGFMTPSAAKAIIDAANASGNLRSMEAAAEHAKKVAHQTLGLLPDYVRASLLFNVPNIFINSWVGPYGSAVMGALEHLVADPTDQRAIKAFINLANPVKVVKAYGKNFKQAGDVIEQANNRGETSQALENAPRVVRRILSTPGQIMTAGDLAAKDMLTDAGFSIDTARGMTLTDEPEMGWARALREGMRAAQTEDGKKSIAARLALPFHKTVLNQAEASLERTPIIGYFANKYAKDIADPINLQAAQQIVGGGVMGVMFIAGMQTPADPATTPILMKVISNAGGQYGMLAASAFAAGQIYAERGSIEEAATKFGNALVNNVPLPTSRPIKELGQAGVDVLQHIAGEEDIELPDDIPRSLWPQGLRQEDIENSLENTQQLLGIGTESTPRRRAY